MRSRSYGKGITVGLLIAVQPDNYGPGDSASPIWTRLLEERGHQVREVNVYRADILQQLEDCHGFMWRHAHFPGLRLIAKRLMPVLEGELGLAVYPDQNTCWHYDDKIAQAYLFKALDIPAPRTWIWFDKALALEFAAQAQYPIVMKLSSGAGSSNVMLLHSVREARSWIRRLFDHGVRTLAGPKTPMLQRAKKAAVVWLRGSSMNSAWEIHRGYALLQEFLPDNRYDTRVTVIGNRAFAYRRFNRPSDFRASGSGLVDYAPGGIAQEFVQLAFDTARQLKAQSCAIDGLWRDGQAVVGEVSYTFISRLVYACPGHWDRDMNWHPGQMRPEEAQIVDFLLRLDGNAK